MYVSPDKLSSSGKSAIESLFSLAETQLKTIESVARLNLGSAREGLESGTEHFKSLMDAKDPQELVKLNMAYSQPVIEKATSYGKSLYEVATETQSTVSKLFESNIAEVNKSLSGLIDNLSKNAPVGTEQAVSALKAWVAACTTAYDSVSRVAKQAAEVVEANFNNAATATTSAKPRKNAA